MTGNLYDNIALLAPDGEMLSHVPKKRSEWYIRKDLAERINESTVRLKFEPSGRAKNPDWYYVEHKNICVVCGLDDAGLLEKHHIVPICFRTHLPEHFKKHRSFDLALVCQDCHDDYEVHAHSFKKKLIAEVGLELYETTAEYKTERSAIKAMKSIIKGLDGRPPEFASKQKEKILAVLKTESFSVDDVDILLDKIKEKSVAVFKEVVKRHIPHERFIVRWREHFLEKAAPRFIDPAWIRDAKNVL